MKKLIVQIPCYNEAATLPEALAALPRQIPGIDRIEILIIDDGSKDGTVRGGASRRRPSYRLFSPESRAGGRVHRRIEESLRQGADIIVNTDADNQYEAKDIPRLIEPLLAGRADIVVGDRQVMRSCKFFTHEEAPAGARQLGDRAGFRFGNARCHQRLSRHDARCGAPHFCSQRILLYAGDPDPGRRVAA